MYNFKYLKDKPAPSPAKAPPSKLSPVEALASIPVASVNVSMA